MASWRLPWAQQDWGYSANGKPRGQKERLPPTKRMHDTKLSGLKMALLKMALTKLLVIRAGDHVASLTHVVSRAEPNQRVSASRRPSFVPCPTQAT